MNVRRDTFWHWPGWSQLGYALALGFANSLWFGVAYGGADWLSEHHSFRVRLHLGIDLSVPFVPAMTIFYLSLNVCCGVRRSSSAAGGDLLALSVSLASATLVAAIFFVLLPGQQAYAPPQDHELGDWAGIYHFACWLAMTHNYLPSLHVAFTTIAIAVYRDHAKRWKNPIGRLGAGHYFVHHADPSALSCRCRQRDTFGLVGGPLDLSTSTGQATTTSNGRNTAGQPSHVSRATGLMLPAFCPRARQRR